MLKTFTDDEAVYDTVGHAPRCQFSRKIPAGFCLSMSYGRRKRSYDQGVVSGGEGDFRLRCITSSPSQTIRSRLVRTAMDAAVSAWLDACRRSSRLYFSHFAIRTVYNTIDLYAVYAAIFVQNRVFLPTPPAFDAPVRGVPVGI